MNFQSLNNQEPIIQKKPLKFRYSEKALKIQPILHLYDTTKQKWKYLNFINISFFFSFFRGQKRISAEEVKIFIDYFRKHAGSKLCVDREGFRKLISTKNSDYYSERIFSLVDQNKDNRVCIDEYTEFMTKLSTDDQNGMIEFLFKIFDTDGRYLVCTAMHWYTAV